LCHLVDTVHENEMTENEITENAMTGHDLTGKEMIKFVRVEKKL